MKDFVGSSITPSQFQSFLQEVALLHYLNTQHDGFAQLYGFTEEHPTMILKYYKLGSLKSFIEGPVIWSKKLVYEFAMDISQALSVMHRLGFVHCDIKADNILIDKNELKKRYFCVLTDLGISRVVTDLTMGVNQFRPKKIFGLSIHYAAPELFCIYRDKKKDERTPDVIMSGDIYALAIVLHLLITHSIDSWRAL